MRESRQPPSFINWSPGDRDVFRALWCLSCLSFVLLSESVWVLLLPFFRVIFGIPFALFCLLSVLSSGLFCVYPVFFPYCTANRLVLLLSFLRVTFKILLCLFCLSLGLLWSPFVFVLFLLCVYFISVYFLCYFQIVLVFPPFNFCIIRRFVFYCLC